MRALKAMFYAAALAWVIDADAQTQPPAPVSSTESPAIGKASPESSASTKSTVDPPTVDFHEQTVGQTKAGKVVTFLAGTDTKSKSLRLKASGDFSVSPEHCEPFGLNTPCSVTVAFAPKQVGDTTGELVVVDSDIAWPRVKLRGTGICGSESPGNTPWYLAAAAVMYLLGFVVIRWNLIALPTRNLLIAQLDATAAQIDSLPAAGIPAALKNLLTKAYELTKTKDLVGHILFWSRGNEIAAWGYAHQVEEMLSYYLPQAQARVRLEEVSAELRQLNKEPALTLASMIDAEFSNATPLSPDQRALLSEVVNFLKSVPALLANEIKAALAATPPDPARLQDLLNAVLDQLRARAKLVDALQAAKSQLASIPEGLKTLIDDLLTQLDVDTSKKLQALQTKFSQAAATTPFDWRDRLDETAKAQSLPLPAFVDRIAQALAANHVASIDRWRALLSEGLGLVYDSKDTKFATLMTWHNKTAWLLGCAMLFIAALAVIVGNAVLLLVGAVGGLLSRLSRTLYGSDVPTDYGASWTTLFLSPVVGALSAWGGILLIALAVQLRVLGAAIDVSWCNAASPLVLALALMLGFTERFFDQILKPLQDKILAQQAATQVALKITSNQQLPPVPVGAPYSVKLAAMGGSPPYNWNAIGQWPSGLKIDGKAGEITGTASTKDSFSFVVQVTDSKGAIATQTVNLEVK